MRIEDFGDYLRLRRLAENPLQIVRFRKGGTEGQELCVRLRGRPPFYVRGGRSDFHMFHRIFLRDEYHLAPLLAAGFDTVVDLGGNVGTFSARIAPHCKRVVTCEPVPENCDRMDKNLGGYPNVHRRAVAVSDRETVLRIFSPREAKTSGVWSSYREGHEHHLTDAAVEVPALSLDTLFREEGIDSVDLLKIDVEGAEYAILYAAEHLLGRVRRIHGEFHDVDRADPRTRWPAFGDWLARQGYRVAVQHHRRMENHGMFFAERAT